MQKSKSKNRRESSKDKISGKEDVSIVKCKDYVLDDVKFNIRQALEQLGGIRKIFSKEDSVLIKPNLLAAKKPEDGVTTHPAMVEAVVEILQEYGIKDIAVGDSPALDSARKALESSGIKAVCERHGVTMLEFKKSRKVHSKKNTVVKEFSVAKEVIEYDKIINLPKMKTHSFTMFTGATKNIFGFIVGKAKVMFHMRHRDPLDFSEMLLDLNNVIKPSLTIMDGISGMEGNGPSGGEVRNFGVLIAGTNALAVDSCATELMGMNKVPIVIAARKRRLPGAQMKEIRVYGENIDDIRFHDVKLPNIGMISTARGIFSKMRKVTARRPVIIEERCISCRRCHEICPADAITMVDNKIDEKDKTKVPSIDYKRCIRCYCCHEVCPVKAIELKRVSLH
ncbi:MAG: DUF362 domain-containing protein [Candidatus Woesearchaeota archaeon]